ncbi:MAG: peptidoglycan editing factor PgeF [Anaerolineae bacterium]|nr:peptidoglycan editing factor PgeF [Anaerolineae bacterium]
MRRTSRNGLVFYQFEQWQDAVEAPVHGVFTRIGGMSAPPWDGLNVGSTVGDDPEAVARNRALLLEALQLQDRAECTVWQVHSADTIVVNGAGCEERVLAQADGMVTRRRDVTLTMRFADCVPILFYDPAAQVIGMAHAGWRGTVAGAGPSVVRRMVAEYGCRPADIQAGIGPSIGPEHYQVGEEVVEAVQAVFGTLDGLIRRADDGSAYLNLWEANRRALQAEGLRRIEVAGICTASTTGEFYSHRAEKGRTGRFGAALALPANE